MRIFYFKTTDLIKFLFQKRIFFAFLLIYFSSFDIACANSHSMALNIRNLDQHIQQQIKDQKVIGCAVAVVDHGKIIFMKAYGVRKKGDKALINLDTVFQLGSISKPISATLAALLIKENRLKLDSAVADFYPHILSATKIQHILSHTTGYERKGWNQKIETHQNRDLLLKQLAASEQTKPGDEFDYHNLAYSLIEEIITSALEKPFPKALELKLLQPLGMTQTKIGDMEFSKQPNTAWPHQEDKEGAMRACKCYSRYYHQSVCSAGGISASIKDMSTFLLLQLGGRPDILSLQDLSPFHTPVVEAPDAIEWMKPVIKSEFESYYGLGWRIIDTPKQRIVFHGGWLKGFVNFLAFIPDRHLGIIILNNSESRFSKDAGLAFLEGTSF